MTRRDRHGRGLRRPLLPFGAPGHSTRAERFDDTVTAAVERLESRWGNEWGRIEFGIEDVPPSDPAPWEDGVPLSRVFPADLGQPTRIVLYRRPIEHRCEPADVPVLVRDVMAEQVGHVLGVDPEDVDPEYRSDL